VRSSTREKCTSEHPTPNQPATSDWLQDVDPQLAFRYHGDAGWDTEGTGPPVASTTAGGGCLSGTTASLPVSLAIAGRPATPPAAYDCYNITTVRYPPHYKRVLGAAARPGCSEDHGINNPLQSAHPGGLLAAMADGSVQFVSQTTDLAVLLRLAIRDDGTGLRVRGGQELTRFTLHSGEEVRTPLAVVQFWKGELVRSQNIWRRWMLAHNLPRFDGQPMPPGLMMCTSDFYPGMRSTAAGEMRYVDAYVKAGVKLDYWWIDAGWYPCEPEGWPRVGTWEPDPGRYPKGLKDASHWETRSSASS
jgi:hypothetical protein